MQIFYLLIIIYVLFQLSVFGNSTSPCYVSNATSPCYVWKTIRVEPSGGGDYTNINDAVQYGVPMKNSKWIHIRVAAGIYIEQVEIPYEKEYIFLEGEGSDKTVLAHNGGTSLKDAALHVYAQNFIAKGITFKNTFNHYIYQYNNPRKPAGAVFLEGDKHSFINCSFLGVQDTLGDALGRHYFQNCYIEGFVDFICGDGQSIYKDCTVNVTTPAQDLGGYITAQKRTNQNSSSGFVFVNGKIIGSGLSKLGRAWGPFSRVIFYKTEFANIISPLGWDSWNAAGSEQNLIYSEVDCIGPGANKSQRVPWEKELPANDVKLFTDLSYINSDSWMQQQPITIDYV